MHTQQELLAIRRNVIDGPPLVSVVLCRLGHQGMRGYELMIRSRGGANLEPICAWLASPDTDPHELWDEVFDLTFECVAKLMKEELRLFD
jgi:hypothetical protein